MGIAPTLGVGARRGGGRIATRCQRRDNAAPTSSRQQDG